MTKVGFTAEDKLAVVYPVPSDPNEDSREINESSTTTDENGTAVDKSDTANQNNEDSGRADTLKPPVKRISKKSQPKSEEPKNDSDA